MTMETNQKLQLAKEWYNDPSTTKEEKSLLEKFFPSLKEMVKNEIIAFIVQSIHRGGGTPIPREKENRWLSWLEKQGEMKSDINDDILLRFAFYQYDDNTLYLSSVFVEECNRKRGYGSKILKAAEKVAKTFGISKIRLKVETNSWMEEWYKRNGYEYLTSEGKYDWLEKQCEQTPIPIVNDWIEDYWQHSKVNNPDSYDGGDEIHFDHDGFVRFCQTHCQKFAWSEEDEKMLKGVISSILISRSSCEEDDDVRDLFDNEISWLESIKERMKGK